MLLIALYFLFSSNSSASASDIAVTTSVKPIVEQKIEAPVLADNKCEALAVSKELEAKYHDLKKNIESDYSTGLPSQLKVQLTSLRMEADTITLKVYDLQNNNQEINNIVTDTVNKLDQFIQILPSIANNAPKLRDQYIVPFANLNSLKADEQECLYKMRTQASQDGQPNANINIYEKLTLELQQMSSNLHEAETISPQKFIILRSELMETLTQYNKKNRLEDAQTLLATIPQAIHAIQKEIENLLPGLQLSQNYYSITTL